MSMRLWTPAQGIPCPQAIWDSLLVWIQIQEKDIIGCENGQVTYRWRDSKTKKMATRTVSGATFLWLLMQHVLPKGFRRARNFGFLHPNCKRLIALLRLLVFKLPVSALVPTPRAQLLCTGCGSPMVIVRRRILPTLTEPPGGDGAGAIWGA